MSRQQLLGIAGRLLDAAGLGGLWLLDKAEIVRSYDTLLSNGFWTNDPERVFHIGLWIAVVALLRHLVWR